MKARRTHAVPLSRQVLELLTELKTYRGARLHLSRLPHPAAPDEREKDQRIISALELLLWLGDASEIHRAWCTRIIEEILERKSFLDLVLDIPEKEAEALRYDLVLLRFLPGPLHP